MAEDMNAEQIATRWMRMKDIQRPEKTKPDEGLFGKVTEIFKKTATPVENPAQLVEEAYDLFVEKQDLQSEIFRRQRALMEPVEEGIPEKKRWSEYTKTLKTAEAKLKQMATQSSLTLEQKQGFIRQGKIGAILQSVSAAEPFGEVVAKSQARTKDVDARLDQIFTTPGMYDKFHEDLTRQVRVRHHAREVESLDKFTEQVDVLAAKLTRAAQVQSRTLTSVERQLITDNQLLKKDAVLRRQELLKDPEVFDRVRIGNLQEYQRQMKKDRFAETPSRKAYLGKIESYWAEGKKVLLTGETGTGKTEVVKHASNTLFGVNPESVTGHQDMSIYELLGKTGFRVQEGDVFRPAPLVRAMTGREGKGQPFLFDEIDRAPNQSVMGIKTILNARPGEKGIRVQTDSAGSFNVGPDYAVAATANIKSEKYATATELDPAIVRVFDAPMDIDYIPAPEVYDLALAALMDKRGGIPLSESDARAVLKNLCDAASWIQDAYQGRQVVTDPASGTTLEARGQAATGKAASLKVVTDPASGTTLEARGQAATGKAASLKKALLDPGRTLDMLNGWSAAQVKGISFEDYLNQRVVEFINNRAYPDEDRYYLTEIFALKGFLRGKKSGELMVAGLTQDTLDKWSGATGRGEAKTGAPAYLSADRVAKLDPYRRFKRPASADAEDLLAEADGSATEEPLVVLINKYQAIKDLVGDIRRRNQPKSVHFAYLNKLEDLGKKTTSAAEKKQAIALLEEYSRQGAYHTKSSTYGEVDQHIALTTLALQKAGEIRLAMVNSTSDFGVIQDFAGDITVKNSKQLHHGYIDRVHDLGINTRTTAAMRKAIELLEEYSRQGAYNTQSSMYGEVDQHIALTTLALQKAGEIRQKMLGRL